MAGLANVAPKLLDRVSEAVLFELQLGAEAPVAAGNLWNGNAQAQVRGRDRRGERRGALPTRAAARHPLAPALVAGSLALSLGLLLLRRHRDR